MTSAAVTRPRRYRMSMICRSRRVRTRCVDVLICYFYNTTAIDITPRPASVNRQGNRHVPAWPGREPGWSPVLPGNHQVYGPLCPGGAGAAPPGGAGGV